MSDKPRKLSPVEGFKTESNYLRGTIAEELASDAPGLSKEGIQLIKHHGSYEQDDRDRRLEARANKVPGNKYYSYMVRLAIPGGRLSSEQFLAQLDLCDELGNSTMRATTRQGLQLHGVLKQNLKAVIRRINETQLTTLAACGDVRRNVMVSPAPFKNNPVYDQMQEMADAITEHLNPRTSAYHELWLTDDDGNRTLAGGGPPKLPTGNAHGSDEEPIYGPTYLPRKFKIGIAVPGDNSADVYSQDIGLLAIVEGEGEDARVVGYNMLVGGGFGNTPSAKKTFAAVGQTLGYVSNEETVALCEAVVKVQRDYGNRTDRKVARLKYLVSEVSGWGIDRFRQKVEEYYGGEIDPARDMPTLGHDDGMGWREQGDGRWFYGLNIENGRIADGLGPDKMSYDGPINLKTALREVCTKLAPPIRVTPHQGLIFCDLEAGDKEPLLEILRSHNVPLTEDISNARRWSMACPALPMCGLAVTESERALPSLMDELDSELTKLELTDEVFTTRMTGCPNGCARPYNSDIGLVGKTKGKYTVLLGGRSEGDRLNWIYKDLVPTEEVVPTLTPVLKLFKEQRADGESFGDFCHRIGKDELLTVCDDAPADEKPAEKPAKKSPPSTGIDTSSRAAG
ncbi:MAG: NADPH-dependent assimilatory sulfite reductase hemoprotein subunit [Planctomycetota bacterium]